MSGGTLCAGHAGLGLVHADPREAQAKSTEAKRAKANTRQERIDRARLPLREQIALALADRFDDVIRVIVHAPLDAGDARAVHEAIAQGFGKPTERVETTEVAGKAIEELDDAGIKALEQRVLRLVDTPAPDPG